MKEISLLSHQIKHVSDITSCLEGNDDFYIDCSVMGSGKTFVSLHFAKKYNLKIFVVCPKSMISSWRKTAKEYSVGVVDTITYQSLRGTTKTNSDFNRLNHPYLERRDGYVLARKYTEFKATPQFVSAVAEGMLLVFDEIQYVKNDTDQSKACIALVKAFDKIKRNKSFLGANVTNENSKKAFLSATPFDKPECTINLLKLTGIVTSDNLTEGGEFGRNLMLTGLAEVINKCMSIDPETTSQELTEKGIYVNERNIVQNPFVKKRDCMQCAYDLYVKVLVPVYIHIMPPPMIRTEFDAANSFYTFGEEMEGAVKYFRKISGFRGDNVTITNDTFGQITRALMLIEEHKVAKLVQILRKEFSSETNSNRKFIIYVNFNKSIKMLYTSLREHNPLLLHGGMSIEKRKDSVDKFQEYNLKHRLLIGNTKVGGIGIDLHDTHGEFPRTLYIIPTFSILDLHQATGRIYRSGVKSTATVRFVYSNYDEVKILNALAKKTCVLKSITTVLEDQKVPSLKKMCWEVLRGSHMLHLPEDYKYILDDIESGEEFNKHKIQYPGDYRSIVHSN